jgi:uncharacterized protein YndB with AHSA1/START domain
MHIAVRGRGMQNGVALHNILVRAHPKAVWDVLADAYSYDRWVFGTRRILYADPDWPEVGSSLSYEAGFGPLRVRSRTVVRHVEEPRRLELEADVWPLGARVAMEVKPWGDDALVVLEEHWIRGPYVLLESPFIHLALNIRNRLMVRSLAEEAQKRDARR